MCFDFRKENRGASGSTPKAAWKFKDVQEYPQQVDNTKLLFLPEDFFGASSRLIGGENTKEIDIYIYIFV